MKTLFYLVFTALLSAAIYAQRIPDRMYVFNPLFNTANHAPVNETQYINSAGGWGEFGAYRIERDAEHNWYIKLGSFIEFFRTGESKSFAFISNVEFVANPDNDIRFKPRALIWEEGFVYTGKTESYFWQIGYFHRCKHDLDMYFYRKQRAMIFGSIQSKFIFPLDFLNEKDNALFSIRGELYTIRQDERFPSYWMDHSYNWNQLIGTAGFNFNFTKEISPQYFNYYFNSYFHVNLFSSYDGYLSRFKDVNRATLNGGISAGIAIRGNAEFRIGLGYEYLSDTSINPFPEPAHLVSIGVTVLNHTSIR